MHVQNRLLCKSYSFKMLKTQSLMIKRQPYLCSKNETKLNKEPSCHTSGQFRSFKSVISGCCDILMLCNIAKRGHLCVGTVTQGRTPVVVGIVFCSHWICHRQSLYRGNINLSLQTVVAHSVIYSVQQQKCAEKFSYRFCRSVTSGSEFAEIYKLYKNMHFRFR